MNTDKQRQHCETTFNNNHAADSTTKYSVWNDSRCAMLGKRICQLLDSIVNLLTSVRS
jgi:hypothetical protein